MRLLSHFYGCIVAAMRETVAHAYDRLEFGVRGIPQEVGCEGIVLPVAASYAGTVVGTKVEIVAGAVFHGLAVEDVPAQTASKHKGIGIALRAVGQLEVGIYIHHGEDGLAEVIVHIHSQVYKSLRGFRQRGAHTESDVTRQL